MYYQSSQVPDFWRQSQDGLYRYRRSLGMLWTEECRGRLREKGPVGGGSQVLEWPNGREEQTLASSAQVDGR